MYFLLLSLFLVSFGMQARASSELPLPILQSPCDASIKLELDFFTQQSGMNPESTDLHVYCEQFSKSMVADHPSISACSFIREKLNLITQANTLEIRNLLDLEKKARNLKNTKEVNRLIFLRNAANAQYQKDRTFHEAWYDDCLVANYKDIDADIQRYSCMTCVRTCRALSDEERNVKKRAPSVIEFKNDIRSRCGSSVVTEPGNVTSPETSPEGTIIRRLECMGAGSKLSTVNEEDQ